MFSNCVLFRCAHLDAESEIGIWLGQWIPCWDIWLLLHFGCQKRSSLIRIMIWSHESKLLGASTFITLLHETKGAKIVILQRTRTGNMAWKGLFCCWTEWLVVQLGLDAFSRCECSLNCRETSPQDGVQSLPTWQQAPHTDDQAGLDAEERNWGRISSSASPVTYSGD